MAISQLKSKRKASGGRLIDSRKKKLYELGSKPTLTKLGEKRVTTLRIKGAHQKIRLLSVENANVYDPKSKSYKSAKITDISESPADPQFVRRNIMTKGSIIETELGKAKITSSPGQHGVVNAVLI